MKRLTSALRSLGWGIGLILLLCVAGVAWIYWGSWRYQQQDDLEHVAHKRAYLEAVSQLGLREGDRPPNIILILFDDLGYGDLGAYGAKAIRTPHIDRLAREGVLLSHYYSPNPVCSPARAGILTGRYPIHTRITQVPMTPGGTEGAGITALPLYELQRAFGVATRLPLEEITSAEVLKAAGYATGMIGKWHLGTESPSLPNERGFDLFRGLLSSNDQSPNPFYHDLEIEESDPVDQTTLTARYTDYAIDFIESHAGGPFFLYLPHTFPHRPLHPSAEHSGDSVGGRYGDVVEDLDRSVGKILAALNDSGIDEETLVLITSDNGPWFQGSPGLRRGRKTNLFDGGFSVPFLARWPGTLPEGVVRQQIAMGIDLFPTILGLAGIPLPEDREIDGRDIWPLLQEGAPSGHEALSFYWATTLGAVRNERFKYHIRRPISVGYGLAPISIQTDMGPWLFDLDADPDESYDVIEKYPEVAAELAAILARRVAADKINPRAFR